MTNNIMVSNNTTTSTGSTNNLYQANVIIANNNNTDTVQSLSCTLTKTIIETSIDAINKRNAFTIALSGGSIPTFLDVISNFNRTYAKSNYKIQYDKWYIVLADERCVPKTHNDSNLGLLQKTFLSKTVIPSCNIYGIDESMVQSLLLLQLSENVTNNNNDTSTTEIKTLMNNIAIDYETKIQSVLLKSNGLLDMAILGFGPDGHTCSLFPNHPIVVSNTSRLIVPISDSPKLPLHRITLTLSVLNTITRNVIFCGVGISKSFILKSVFHSLIETNASTTDNDHDNENTTTNNNDDALKTTIKHYIGTYVDPPPYPCAMVRPSIEQNTSVTNNNSSQKLPVTWIVDDDAIKGVLVKVNS